MPRPGPTFWRRTFLASLVLFLAGIVVTVIASGPSGSRQLSATTHVIHGGGRIGLLQTNGAPFANGFLAGWKYGSDQRQVSLTDVRRWKPARVTTTGCSITVVPAQYISILAAAIGVVSLTAMRRATQRPTSQCAACGYSLTGLPPDAAACPECGSKLTAATSKAP